jgi:hypothetical protein
MVALKETTLYWGILSPKILNVKFLGGCNFDMYKNMNKWNKIKNLEYTKNMKFKHNLI